MTIQITTIAKATALVINTATAGDVLVVRSVKVVRGNTVYDLRQASRQQLRLMDADHSVDLGDEAAEFLSALLDHTVGAIHDRLCQLKG
jgi:hypothetical protein